jgi:predicted component of type VI protein secretion system
MSGMTCTICGAWGKHNGARCPLYRLNEQQEAFGPSVSAVRRALSSVESATRNDIEKSADQIRKAWAMR